MVILQCMGPLRSANQLLVTVPPTNGVFVLHNSLPFKMHYRMMQSYIDDKYSVIQKLIYCYTEDGYNLTQMIDVSLYRG